MEISEKFANKLRFLRRAKGLTQEELAKVFGTSVTNIHRLEGGNQLPRVETLIGLADFFSVSLDYLLDRESKGAELPPDLEELFRLAGQKGFGPPNIAMEFLQWLGRQRRLQLLKGRNSTVIDEVRVLLPDVSKKEKEFILKKHGLDIGIGTDTEDPRMEDFARLMKAYEIYSGKNQTKKSSSGKRSRKRESRKRG